MKIEDRLRNVFFFMICSFNKNMVFQNRLTANFEQFYLKHIQCMSDTACSQNP